MKIKAQANIMVLIMVTIIIAMVAISVVWGIVRSQQDTTAKSTDFTATNGTCIRVTGNCITPSSTTSILNSTGGGTNDEEENFTECGTGGLIYGYDLIAGAPNRLVGSTMNASYTEEACGRITGITGTIIDYIPLLLAVVILVFVAMFAIK